MAKSAALPRLVERSGSNSAQIQPPPQDLTISFQMGRRTNLALSPLVTKSQSSTVDMANPNPSPSTRFKPGDTPNPHGKTSAQRKAEVRAAETAAIIRELALSRMMEKIDAGELDPLDAISSDNLRLFRDSEDRAHGTPKQSVEHSGDAENPLTLRVIERRIVHPD